MKRDRGIENILEELELKYLRRNLMCKLLLSFSQVSFCPVSILSADYGCTIKFLLTNWFGPYRKYLDLSFSYGPHFVRSVLLDCGLNIFPYGPHNWSIGAYYSVQVRTGVYIVNGYLSCPAFSQFDWQMDSAAKQNRKRTLTKIVSKFSENFGKL